MRNIITSTLLSMVVLVLAGCNAQPKLKGFYQSETHVNGYYIQISIFHNDNAFVEYIDNIEVDRGTFEEIETGKYLMTSDQQQFTIDLTKDNTFHMTIIKLNDGNPINMVNLGDVPVTFPVHFDDVEEYKELIGE
ncbi:hypothetical protein [Sporosarcina luteola]|uniref:hypothetical protein n=1 Tax=Sporosarcina luteola TaxID=582850 RepID=UPI00203FA753|nr:hypothetical protein [Sporosarcina luteola]MCM3711945.1 hypothetical protein [Sporosarcina luteola]